MSKGLLVSISLLGLLRCSVPAVADDFSALNGLWIDPSAKCSAARAALQFDMGGVFFEGFDPYAILIADGSVYGLENTCKIRATKRSKESILATMQCAGEGEKYKEIARYNLQKPQELIVGNTIRYKRC
jgi:hypothetical protein